MCQIAPVRFWRISLLLLAILTVVPATLRGAEIGNRLTYLDAFLDPYYVDRSTPRLTTPQWIGNDETKAVIVLAVDDMADAGKYETFLRPILNRLKQIDGRAGMSIMTTRMDPSTPQLQTWLTEGVRIEAHTATHPCPCLQKQDLAAAKTSFDQCIDQLSQIPGSRPTAFRMPCCDSMNSVSPRFFTELFNQTTPKGNFLTVDTSVFLLFTPQDTALPGSLAYDENGAERFRKYIAADRMMVNYVEDYPYPYVIGRLCWEFPPLMPSDWDAQNLNGKCSPRTVTDLKVAVDAVVAKEGVFSLCFHPHGWLRNDQVIELIDHAVERYGNKVMFLSFAEVAERLTGNMLGGQPLRDPQGRDNGVRLCDVNHDGYMDAVIANNHVRQTRVWSPNTGRWTTSAFPFALVTTSADGHLRDSGARFGVLHADGQASVLVANDQTRGMYHFADGQWVGGESPLGDLTVDGPVSTALGGHDRGVRLLDLDLDGIGELIVSNDKQQAAFRYRNQRWERLPFSVPAGLTIVDAQGRDAGLRFVDFNGDHHPDIVFSNAQRFAAYAFTSTRDGWAEKLVDQPRRDPAQSATDELPMIVRGDGTNNGAWFKYGQMWVQNEQTGGTLPHQVDHRSFAKDFVRLGKQPTPDKTPTEGQSILRRRGAEYAGEGKKEKIKIEQENTEGTETGGRE